MRVGSIKKTKDTITSSFLNTSKEGINNKNDHNRVYLIFINSIRSPLSRKTYEFIIKRYMQYYNIQDVNEL
jgi:site-specific recombinase XerD